MMTAKQSSSGRCIAAAIFAVALMGAGRPVQAQQAPGIFWGNLTIASNTCVGLISH